MGKSRARKPTRQEKTLITAAGLVARNWYVIQNTDTELRLVNKGSGKSRTIKKGTVTEQSKRTPNKKTTSAL